MLQLSVLILTAYVEVHFLHFNSTTAQSSHINGLNNTTNNKNIYIVPIQQ